MALPTILLLLPLPWQAPLVFDSPVWNPQENENDSICEQGPFPEFAEVLVQLQDVLWEGPTIPLVAVKQTESSE